MTNPTPRIKVALVTVAQGRCGSSATMGLLKLMNVFVGADQSLAGPAAMNPKGFFELKSQDRFLREAYPAFYPAAGDAPSPADVDAAVDLHLDDFARLIDSEYGGAAVMGLKAPRALTLAFWNRMRDRYDVRILLMHRNHDDHIRSISKIWASSNDAMKRDGGAALIARQFAIWHPFRDEQLERFVFPALDVDFDLLVSNPLQSAERIAAFLEVPAPSAAAVSDWIDGRLVNRAKNTMTMTTPAYRKAA